MSQAEMLLNRLYSLEETDEVDTTLVIDKHLRTIKVPKSITNLGVESDDEVMRVQFKMPATYCGIDLSTFKIRINYLNAKNEGDVYEVTDVAKVGNNLTFSWLVGRHAALYKGKVKFIVCMKDTDSSGNVLREFNTTITTLPILEGLETGEEAIVDHTDLMEQWREMLFGIGDTEEANIKTASETEQEAIEQKGIEVLATIPEDYTTTYEMANNAYRTRANAIVSTVDGETISVSDASDDPLRGLRVFGRTEQYVTSGKQLFDANTSEIFNTKATYRVDGDKITYLSNVTYMVVRLRVHREPIIAGKTYVLECDSISSGLTCQLLGNHVETGESLIDARLMNGNTRVEFTIPESVDMGIFDSFSEDTAYLAMSLFVSDSAHISTEQTVTGLRLYSTDNPMDEWEAYSAGISSPSPEYTQALRSLSALNAYVYGANLFPIREFTAVGITAIPQSDGSVRYTGTSTENAWHVYQQSPIYKSGAYTLTVETTNKTTKGSLIQLVDTDNNICRTWANTLDKFTCRFDARCGYTVRVNIGVNEGDVVDATFKIMLNLGSTATDWVPYISTKSLNVNYPLRGIPVSQNGNYTDANGQQWVCDEIDFERGVYVQRVLKMNLTGSESINRETTSTWSEGCYVVYTKATNPEHINGEIMCDFLPTHSNTDLADGKYTSGIGTHGQPNLFVKFSDDINTLDLFAEKWASAIAAGGNVYAILLNPIETALTAEEIETFKAIHSNYPNTTVLNDADATMELKYNADTKLYLESCLRPGDEQVQNAVDAWLEAHFSSAEGVSF